MRSDLYPAVWLAASLVCASPGAAAAQEPALDRGLPPLLEEAEEVLLAVSAAPAVVAEGATVLVLKRGGYQVAREGTSGVTCYVNRSRVVSVEPHCFDQEGSETILQIQLRRAELREKGWSRDRIDASIAQSLQTGELRLPRRPAVTYMMSRAQELYNDRGDLVGNWQPHVMIYYPYMTSGDIGMSRIEQPLVAAVTPDGGALSNVTIVVPDFVDVPDEFPWEESR